MKKNKLLILSAVLLTVILTLTACSKKTETITPKTYSTYPPMTIDQNKIYIATIKTNYGDIVMELFPKEAPLAVNNFVFLARDGYYDNNKFHRVLKGFVIQTGDPTGTGAGDPGYSFADELPTTRDYIGGILAMANSGPNTNGSQFFITLGNLTGKLAKSYTIFGKVLTGMDVVTAIGNVPVVAKNGEVSSPSVDVYIKTVTIATAYPPMIIDQNKTYTATITTNYGDIIVELFPKEAPLAVNNFVFLARNGYYDNNKFHRVLKGFVIQTGDPTGTGAGDPGYSFADELPTTRDYISGILAMANSGPNTNGSQFFITLGNLTGKLAKSYTIFGKVTSGMDVVTAIGNVPVVSKNGEVSSPSVEVYIKTITITEK